jgi:hypothetical protein
MNDLNFPQSADELCARLSFLHEERKKLPRASRRLSLNKRQRAIVLEKTAGRCHLCGGPVEKKFAADHVLAHGAGGTHTLDNYLAAHGLCNGCKWFYSPEEFQWILRMGVWARKQMEDRTTIGIQMLLAFFKHEQDTRKRRKRRGSVRRSPLVTDDLRLPIER